MSLIQENFIHDLKVQIGNRSLLTHPFYQTWSDGRLTLKALQEYAKQYYKHVAAFPTYLSAIHSNCPHLAVRQQILENLIEEERGPDNHPELWLRFGEALGVDREALRATPALPETSRAIETFKSITGSRSFVEGLAALYAYEDQIPAVASTKIEGLQKFYGIQDPRGLEFFTVHREVDVWHAQAGREIIEQFATTPDQQQNVRRAVGDSLNALWTLLDGVYNHHVSSE